MYKLTSVRIAFAPAATALVGVMTAQATGTGLLLGGAAFRHEVQPDEDGATPPAPAEADSFLVGWEGSVELGLTGASGNNDRVNLRAGASATRETETEADRISLTYSYAEDESEETENRFDAKARHDWKLRDSRWRLYVGGSFEYDEFQDWDTRVSFGPGVGYEAIDDEKTSLLLRAGAVLTREFGGHDNAWTPEADLGFDLEHQITERQSLAASFDFYPSLKEFGPYRFEGDVAWQVQIDPEANLYLKVGLEDRYDSHPGPDKKRNDLTYYATIGWSF